jgi:hypothetical protein
MCNTIQSVLLFILLDLLNIKHFRSIYKEQVVTSFHNRTTLFDLLVPNLS